MSKTKPVQASPSLPKPSADPSFKDSPSQLKSSLNTAIQQSFYMRSDSLFGAMSYHDKSEQQLEASIEQIRKMCKEIEQLIDKKIGKYYTQMREKSLGRETTVQQTVQSLKHEIQMRNQLIKFQQGTIRDTQEQEKAFDSRENIEFAIPIQINQTKKKILQLEKFIHIAEIKQKKKSEDVVKVDKINHLQFEKIAMLRKTLQVEMIYQLTLNERQMKIDEKMYEFQSKIQTLNQKLANLNKIVEQRHIMVSSNRVLILMKEQKAAFDKSREEIQRKIGLLRSGFNKSETSIKREIDQIRNDILQKETRYVAIQKELAYIKKKNDSFLIDATINRSLRKSISYNYAETLLKVKQKQELQNPESNMKMNLSLISESQSLKPNFKVKKMRNQVYSSLSKMSDSKKGVNNITLGQGATLEKTKESNQNSSLYENKLRLYERKHPKPIPNISQGLDEEIVVDDD